MMGSEHKIETLMNELKAEGVAEEALQKVFTPIGVNIYSKTTPEIAVSIAAEIIGMKNKAFQAHLFEFLLLIFRLSVFIYLLRHN